MELINLESKAGTVCLRTSDMALVSARAGFDSEQEFAAKMKDLPSFIVGYFDNKRRYRHISSKSFTRVSVTQSVDGDHQIATGVFSGLAAFDVTVTITATACKCSEYIDFGLTLDNHSDVQVFQIQYPYLVCRFHLDGEKGSETIALPHGYGSGRIIRDAGTSTFDGFGWRRKLLPDSSRAWEFSAERNYCDHYPGMQYAQFLCYYNDRGGIYLCCDDTMSNVKRFLPLDCGRGLRLGVSHVGDWPRRGRRALEYRTRITFFEGDWYAAADIYRAWFHEQKDLYAPIRARGDMPQWLLDSPVYVTVRPVGMLDESPAEQMPEFLPYEKCIPLLERIADQVNSPLAIVLMGWEKRGPWVFPDNFPPAGGEESMRNFIRMARERGWHVGTFGNGTHFVYENIWARDDSGYELADSLNVEQFACREANGRVWDPRWGWRPCVNLCISQDGTLDLAKEFVGRITDWGMESIQLLDQNNGAVTFPCFSPDHGHPPAPGKWMHEGMARFMRELQAIGKPGLEPIHSAESGLNEGCLKLFQETELRIYPPEYNDNSIPMYQYLFHDCVVLHAMMGFAPEPYHLTIRSASAFIYGGIPGGVLRGDGLLLDMDTSNWAEWKQPVENHDNAMRMMRSCNDMRRDMSDFLVFGRMERPLAAFRSERHAWTDPRGGRQDLACVFHTVWSDGRGRLAVAIANWRDGAQAVKLRDGRLAGAMLTLHCAGDAISRAPVARKGGDEVELTVPALCCAMLTVGG